MAHGEVEAELAVRPQGAGLDLVEVLDHVEGAELAATLERLVELGHEDVGVVLAGDLPGGPEAERARGHVLQSRDHLADCTPAGGNRRAVADVVLAHGRAKGNGVRRRGRGSRGGGGRARIARGAGRAA
jgi:hypothetical protein